MRCNKLIFLQCLATDINDGFQCIDHITYPTRFAVGADIKFGTSTRALWPLPDMESFASDVRPGMPLSPLHATAAELTDPRRSSMVADLHKPLVQPGSEAVTPEDHSRGVQHSAHASGSDAGLGLSSDSTSGTNASVHGLSAEDIELLELSNAALSEALGAVKGLQTAIEAEGIVDYSAQLDAEAGREAVTLGLLSNDELQRRQEEIEASRLREEQEKADQHAKRLERVRRAEVEARSRIQTAHAKLQARVLYAASDARSQLASREAQVYRTYQRAFEELRAKIRQYQASVRARYGRLLDSSGGAAALTRQLKVDWHRMPQPMEFRLGRLRCVGNKLPDGLYVLMCTLYNRLGGSPMRWSRLGMGIGAPINKASGGGGTSGASDEDADRPSASAPVRHRGRFYDIDLQFNQCVYGTAPSPTDLRPSHVWVFELYILGGRSNPMDRVVGWGALPACNGDMRVASGRFKVPLLRGEVDPDVDRYQLIEERIGKDLDNWLANLYVESALMPRQAWITETIGAARQKPPQQQQQQQSTPSTAITTQQQQPLAGSGGLAAMLGLRRRRVGEWDVEVAFTSALLRVRGEARQAKRLPFAGRGAPEPPSAASVPTNAGKLKVQYVGDLDDETTGGGDGASHLLNPDDEIADADGDGDGEEWDDGGDDVRDSEKIGLIGAAGGSGGGGGGQDGIGIATKAVDRRKLAAIKGPKPTAVGATGNSRHDNEADAADADVDEEEGNGGPANNRFATWGAVASGRSLSKRNNAAQDTSHLVIADEAATPKPVTAPGGAVVGRPPLSPARPPAASRVHQPLSASSLASTRRLVSSGGELTGASTLPPAGHAAASSSAAAVVGLGSAFAAEASRGRSILSEAAGLGNCIGAGHTITSTSPGLVSATLNKPAPGAGAALGSSAPNPAAVLPQASFTYAVNKSEGRGLTGRRLADAVSKLMYFRQELTSDLHWRLAGTFEFWLQAAQLAIALWLRVYLHYLGQYFYLRALRVPVYDFSPLPWVSSVGMRWGDALD